MALEAYIDRRQVFSWIIGVSLISSFVVYNRDWKMTRNNHFNWRRRRGGGDGGGATTAMRVLIVPLQGVVLRRAITANLRLQRKVTFVGHLRKCLLVQGYREFTHVFTVTEGSSWAISGVFQS
ncbi:hypothetical protein HAX54_020758 [Datura stramonium]|uniref:Uncharacterized protein n=1 Tax=Datura stramonium TaxID=4076 RepID=A0ABS8RJJ9_DATST|nr:hypothetical protein [Datura stramonium]